MIHWNRKRSRVAVLLLAAALLPAGCTPEEKTLILPRASASTMEQENDDPTKDFTVKKIYTYSYTTREGIKKSAFLQGCSENQIHVIAQEKTGDTAPLTYLQVDYRYGFYDSLGNFFTSWKKWLNLSEGQTSEDYYLEKLIPSPDGTRLLVYIRSSFQDMCIVWLYTLGNEHPVVLYEGILPEGSEPVGSFSPSGRWMTYDATGCASGEAHFVPVYDCQKDFHPTDPESLQYGRLRPPDQQIDIVRKGPVSVLRAELYDLPNSVGLLSFLKDTDTDFLSFYLDSNSESGEYAGQDGTVNSNVYTTHSSAYLGHFDGMPFIQYSFDPERNLLYYLGKPSRLWRYDTKRPEQELISETETQLLEFPQTVWNFLRLDSGDFLAVLTQEYADYEITPPKQTNAENINGSLSAIQEYWNIRSADLYLYPDGESEGKLLYKNLQNLISMEYDARNRRILLETCESDSMTHRKCIILEL